MCSTARSNNKGTKEPVSYINMRSRSFDNSTEEHNSIGHPNDSNCDIDKAILIQRILYSIGETNW